MTRLSCLKIYNLLVSPRKHYDFLRTLLSLSTQIFVNFWQNYMVNRMQKILWKNPVLCALPAIENSLVFDPWRHLLTSFWSISLILPLYRLFEQLNAIFTKYLNGLKLFNMARRIFWDNIFLIPCLFFDLWRHLWRHFALFH